MIQANNDPYVKYEVEKEFADTIATEQVLIPNGGHINSESGYDTFEEIVNYLQFVFFIKDPNGILMEIIQED